MRDERGGGGGGEADAGSREALARHLPRRVHVRSTRRDGGCRPGREEQLERDSRCLSVSAAQLSALGSQPVSVSESVFVFDTSPLRTQATRGQLYQYCAVRPPLEQLATATATASG